MAAFLKFPRGPQANLDALAGSNGLVPYSLYWVTDTAKLALALTVSTYVFLPSLGTNTFTGDIVVPADPYGSGWDGSNEVPTKNDLFDKIESLGTGPQAFYVRFVGDGATTVFTLPESVTSGSEIIVTRNGQRQDPSSDYTASGTSLTMSPAPLTGDVVIAERPGGSQGAPGTDGTDGTDGVNAILGWSCGIEGVMADGETILLGYAPAAMTLSEANCRSMALTGATASTTLTLYKKSSAGGAATQIGTIVYSAGGQGGAQAGTVTLTVTSVAANDLVYMTGPATADATLANVSYMIRA